MNSICYPTKDGFVQRLQVLYYVYRQSQIEGVPVEFIEKILESEIDAVRLARDIGNCVVREVVRLPEISVR